MLWLASWLLGCLDPRDVEPDLLEWSSRGGCRCRKLSVRVCGEALRQAEELLCLESADSKLGKLVIAMPWAALALSSCVDGQS